MQGKKRQLPDKRQTKTSKIPSKKAKSIPFDFVLEYLDRLNPFVRPMFGCHAIYVGDKIVLIVRKKDTGKRDNGIWLATTKQHHDSLKSEFPEMRSIKLLGPGQTGWQVIPSDSTNFEESAIKICELVLKHDPRIGKIPEQKKNKNKAKP